MNRTMTTACSFGFVIAVVACGGGGDSGSSEQQSAQKAQSTSPTEPSSGSSGSSGSSCIAPGAKGNDKGVGAYCDKSVRCPDGMLCTGDFGETPSFCTIICSADADCGSAASCYHDPRGSACVPGACLGK